MFVFLFFLLTGGVFHVFFFRIFFGKKGLKTDVDVDVCCLMVGLIDMNERIVSIELMLIDLFVCLFVCLFV